MGGTRVACKSINQIRRMDIEGLREEEALLYQMINVEKAAGIIHLEYQINVEKELKARGETPLTEQQ